MEASKIIDDFKKTHKHTCVYCGKEITNKTDITVDHILPMSRGGKTEESNLAICCGKCNLDKADMTKEEYEDYLNKVEELKDNEILKSIKNMMNESTTIITRYDNTGKTIDKKNKEKYELEKIILNTNFNAAEGYNLCRDLKNILKELNDTRNMRSELRILNTYAIENNKKLNKMYNNILDNKIKILRNELNITRLGQLEDKSA